MEKEPKQMEIELRSDEFQEIIQQSPRWMIRSGIFLVFGIIVIFLAGSYFFRYPDVIETEIVVFAENQPDGNVSLFNSEQQIIPEAHAQIIGRINLPAKGAGKVAVGQKVNIRFENFPYMEYGIIKGQVKSISPIPNNENYIVEVHIPQEMKTNYNIPLKFTPEMKGSAQIITEDLRLIQRFFNPAKSLLKHRISPSE